MLYLTNCTGDARVVVEHSPMGTQFDRLRQGPTPTVSALPSGGYERIF